MSQNQTWLLQGILSTVVHLDAPTTEEEAKTLLLSHFAIRVGSDSGHAAMNEVDTWLSQIARDLVRLPLRELLMMLHASPNLLWFLFQICACR